MAPRTRLAALALLLAAALAAAPAAAQDIESFEKNLTLEKLDNGLTILIYERPTAPVASFYTYADVGSAQEVNGITGLAHMFEHMAFKGTTTIGTKNWKAEKKALAAVDEAYATYAAERDRQGGPDPERLAEAEAAFKKAQEDAAQYIQVAEYDEAFERAGGVGMNASTGADGTDYYYSLPANKIELWAFLESEHLLDPVMREFYKERDVVQEERRMRAESQPIGRLIEQFLTMAFIAHSYGMPGIGYMSDLQSFTRQDAYDFFEKYYVPANLTVAVVGDVDAEKTLPMLRKYFGRLPAGEKPAPLRTVEPKQIAEKQVIVPDPSQPLYVEGYHRPAATHPDDAVYDAISDILSSGRTSRLYRSLVRDKQIAAFAGAFNGFPGSKYPHLTIFFGVTTPGHTNEEIQEAIRFEIERLKTEPVGDEELQKVKTQAKASLIRGLSNNPGIAEQLAAYQAVYGDWRELFRSVDRIDKVTAEDIMRMANATFVSTNRTIGQIVNEEEAEEE
jgi:predicted Zn-dependent peptidase